MNTATVAETSTVAAAQVAPTPFSTVPEVTLPNATIVPSFQVGQYFCSKGADGLATVSASAAPWVSINYHESVEACKAAGFVLITELQMLAIAHDIASVAANWTGGKVGVGDIKRGLSKGTVDQAQPGTYVSPAAGEDRWFALSNGELICDAAGNIYSWIFDNVQGDEHGIVAAPFADDSPSITTAPHPSMTRGMGWRPRAGANWSGVALVRGGYWGDGDFAGVFDLDYDSPGYRLDVVGFRCTKPSGL